MGSEGTPEPDHPSRAAPETDSVSELIPRLRTGQVSVPRAAAEMKPHVCRMQSGPRTHTCPSSVPCVTHAHHLTLCPQSEGADVAQRPRRLCPGSRGAGRGGWESEAPPSLPALPAPQTGHSCPCDSPSCEQPPEQRGCWAWQRVTEKVGSTGRCPLPSATTILPAKPPLRREEGDPQQRQARQGQTHAPRGPAVTVWAGGPGVLDGPTGGR